MIMSDNRDLSHNQFEQVQSGLMSRLVDVGLSTLFAFSILPAESHT